MQCKAANCQHAKPRMTLQVDPQTLREDNSHYRYTLTNKPTNQPTPCSRVLEKLTVAQPIKPYPVFCGTRRLITGLTGSSTGHINPVHTLPPSPTNTQYASLLSPTYATLPPTPPHTAPFLHATYNHPKSQSPFCTQLTITHNHTVPFLHASYNHPQSHQLIHTTAHR
jgi:hypothetical protein